MRTSDYWERRFTAMDDAMYKNTEQYIKSLQKRFERATRQMSKDMAYWYSKLAENNEISYQAARQLLSQDELEDFKMTLEEYIKHGSELDLDPSWRKKLVNASAKVHISRLEEMQLELQNTIENLYSEYNGSLTEYLSELVPNTYYHTAYEIAKGTGVATTLHKLDSEAINQFLTKPWVEDGKAFSERIWARRDDLVNSVNKELTQLLITGKDPQKAIDTIARDFAVDKSAAGRLVMTESAAMANEARRQCMKDLDVEEYEVIATLDSKTSPICRSMDGKHFPMTQFKIGVNAPPFHCNCRTTTVPYFNDEFTERETRAARDDNDEGYVRKERDFPGYEEWKTQYVVREESLRSKRSLKQDYGVDWSKVKSKEYTNKFSQLSENKKANSLAATRSRQALIHRDGLKSEELYAIDLDNGKDIASITDQYNDFGVKRTKKFTAAMNRAKEKGSSILYIHNHPRGAPPSVADINELVGAPNSIGITVGHDGRVFRYSAPSEKITKRDIAVAARKITWYDGIDEDFELIKQLSKSFKFDFTEL